MVGRTLPLWLSDRNLGPINTTILMKLFTLVVVLPIWLPLGATTPAALFAVVVLMGVGTGSLVPLAGNKLPLLRSPLLRRYADVSLKLAASAQSASPAIWGPGLALSTVSLVLRKLVPPHPPLAPRWRLQYPGGRIQIR